MKTRPCSSVLMFPIASVFVMDTSGSAAAYDENGAVFGGFRDHSMAELDRIANPDVQPSYEEKRLPLRDTKRGRKVGNASKQRETAGNVGRPQEGFRDTLWPPNSSPGRTNAKRVFATATRDNGTLVRRLARNDVCTLPHISSHIWCRETGIREMSGKNTA